MFRCTARTAESTPFLVILLPYPYYYSAKLILIAPATPAIGYNTLLHIKQSRRHGCQKHQHCDSEHVARAVPSSLSAHCAVRSFSLGVATVMETASRGIPTTCMPIVPLIMRIDSKRAALSGTNLSSSPRMRKRFHSTGVVT